VGWWVLVLAVSGSCSPAKSPPSGSEPRTLRLGVGPLASASPIAGIQYIAQAFSTDSLFYFPGDNARPAGQLAKSLTVSDDGLLLRIALRPEARFHDGSPVTSEIVAEILSSTLPQWIGPSREDVQDIVAAGPWDVDIHLRRRSNLVIESLEVAIRKPQGNVGTGPYRVEGDGSQLVANENYFLGPPRLERIVLSRYPTIRAAWADMLRGQIDMLFDVSLDAVESLTGATNVRLLTFTKAYQYVLGFNRNSSVFKDPQIRRALNIAIDRGALVKNALLGYGVPSGDPVWPRYWALGDGARRPSFDPTAAANIIKRQAHPVRFVCLTPAEFERVGLELRRQLAAIGVDMELREVTQDELLEALRKHDFDAVLSEFLSGPSFARIYSVWHAKGGFDFGLGNATFDAALDDARHAANDNEYRTSIAALERAAVDDPPGIFLAWSQGIRAISAKFDVPIERDRDPLGALRDWRRANDAEYVNRN